MKLARSYPAESLISSSRDPTARRAASFTRPQNKQIPHNIYRDLLWPDHALPRHSSTLILSLTKGRFEARSREPKALGQLGRPSKWLTPAEKEIWRSLVKSAPSVLGESDRTLLEITVILKDKLKKRTCRNSEIKELINCLKQLGIVPKERQAVKQEADAAPDEWDLLDA